MDHPSKNAEDHNVISIPEEIIDGISLTPVPPAPEQAISLMSRVRMLARVSFAETVTGPDVR
jgi:hypothetical protein